MTHRTPTPIKQAIPEIVCAAIPESWMRSLLGAVILVLGFLFLIFFVEPAIRAGMEQCEAFFMALYPDAEHWEIGIPE